MGRLHILVLHLPIGILLLGVAIEWMTLVKRFEYLSSFRSVVYGFGALSAVMACVTGYLLSVNGDYHPEAVSNHLWAGLVTACLATLLYFLALAYHQNFYQKWLSLAVAISVGVTGHLGGSITHGEGFLFQNSSSVKTGNKPIQYDISDIDQAILYTDIINPILHSKCVSCHNEKKSKGKLRLDNGEEILKGGKSKKPLLVASEGNEEGELLARIHLDINQKAHMPPKSKSQLSDLEIKMIETWMSLGAPFEGTVNELDSSTILRTQISQLISQSAENDNKTSVLPAMLPEADIAPVPTEILNALAAANVVVLPVGKGSHFLDLNFVNADTIRGEIWKNISKMTDNVHRLKLSGLQISPEGFAVIGQMKYLSKLYLDQTSTIDSDIDHLLNLKQLRYLNLSQTAVTAMGINKLNVLQQLESVYAYGTSLDRIEEGQLNFKLIAGPFTVETFAEDTLRISEN